MSFDLTCTCDSRSICVSHVSTSLKRLSIAEAARSEIGEGVWWISRVFVEPSTRGKGLGTALLNYMVNELRFRDVQALLVAPGGYNANYNRQVHFYEKNGFKKMGTDDFYRLELS